MSASVTVPNVAEREGIRARRGRPGALLISTLLTLLLAFPPAFAQGGQLMGQGAGHAHPTPAQATPAHEARAHSTISSEADFIRAMIPHHREAVNVADLAVERGQREEVRALAQAIVEAQSRELELLELWLADLPEGAAEADLYEPMMRDLVGLAPQEVDRVFLEDMIGHHEAAVAMAEAYLMGDFPKRPEVAELAETIIRAQREEQRLIEAWLLEWYGVPPSRLGN